MCDSRGMSIEAPAPVLPIRDTRIERATAPLCTDHAPFLAAGHRVRRGVTVVDGGSIESWIKTEVNPLPIRIAVRAAEFMAHGLAKAPGHDSDVFRPPRAA